VVGFALTIGCAVSGTAQAAELVATERAGFFVDQVAVGQGTTLDFELDLIATGDIGCFSTPDSGVTGRVATRYSIAADGSVSAEELSSPEPFYSNGEARLVPPLNCGVTWRTAPEPYHVRARVTVAADTPPGTYKFRIPTETANPGLSAVGPLTDEQPDELTFTVTPPLLPPLVDDSFNAAPLSGTAEYKLPGQDHFQPLLTPEHLAIGTVIDGTDATVTIYSDRDGQSTVQTAEAGGDVFTPRYLRVSGSVGSARAAQKGTLLTDFVLPDPTGCPPGRLLAAGASGAGAEAARKRPRFRIKKRGGAFAASNRDVQGAGIGSEWATLASCAGTLVGVQDGRVRIVDKHLDRSFLVAQGQAYLSARPGTVEAKAQRATGRGKARGGRRIKGRTSQGQVTTIRLSRSLRAVRQLSIKRDLDCRHGVVRSVRRGTLQLTGFRVTRKEGVFAGARAVRPALDSLIRSGSVAVNARVLAGGSKVRGAISERLVLRDGTRCRSGAVRLLLGRP
jgi:hypothetical protein